MKKLITPLLLTFILFNCSCSRSIYLQVMKPAEITIPQHIKKLGIVNRSVVDKKQETKDKVLNVLEGLLSGEEIGADRDASEQCLNALLNTVQAQKRIEYIRINANVQGTGMTYGKAQLTWNEVEDICKLNDLDGLLVLEAFDSDNSLKMAQGFVKVKNKDGSYTDVPESTANAYMHVTSQWRIYDRRKKQLFDQIMNTNDRNFTTKGADDRSAVLRLPNKRQMLNETGYAAGVQFGGRVSPVWINVQRSIYKGKGDDMKFGYKLFKKGDWDKAIQVWNRNSENVDHKIARKAAYNMAVAGEREGQLDIALEWAKKSSENGRYNPGQRMVWILEQRIRDENKLRIQLGE